MTNFFNSKFVKDLGNGELPEVPISLERGTIVNIAIVVLIVGVLLILFSKVLDKYL